MDEFKIQHESFKWYHNNFTEYRKLLFAIPNGGTRNLIEASRMKMTGTTKGIPDMLFTIQQKAFYFEFKTKKGILSPEQKEMILKLKLNGFPVYVIRSTEQFQRIFIFIIMEQIENTFKRLNEIHDVKFFQMSIDELIYENKIFKFVCELKNDSIIVIDEICEKKNQGKFIEAIKKMIVLEIDNANNFVLEFNSDFTKFKKFESAIHTKK
jgi:hypothetical protein